MLQIAGTLRPDGLWDCLPDHLRPEKAQVKGFYDETGWKTDDAGEYVDAALFVDRRGYADRYLARCRARVLAHLPQGGEYLLDVASGPVHFPEYRAYSERFEHRVCVDLSETALHDARRNVGDTGVYVLGDVTRLPLETGTVDAAVSLHTLYHVPSDEQAAAFREIHRVLKPGGVAVIVYYWQTPHFADLNLAGKLLALPGRVIRRLTRSRASDAQGELYYHAHTRQWFEAQDWPFRADVLSWSSVDTGTLHRLGPATRVLFWLEARFPRLFGRRGYPMIVIRKN